ncbi:MAG TPA: radical SAM family heme chaperone HemW [Xanthobacteraceae bacterium]
MADAATLTRPLAHAAADDPVFGVYVHWPFCLSKCPYCDFNSHVRHEKPDETRFASAITTELAYMRARIGTRTVKSVFFGGGTPSLMKPATVGSIIDAIGRNWEIASDCEITLEANPTSVEAENFRGYRSAGVNRVSLGVQALDDAQLKVLGRLHTVEEALKAIAIAKAAFPRVSFDLIYARPDQTPAAWRAELKRALDQGAEHLSLYQLTIEDGTPFAALHRAGKLKVPDAELARVLWDVTQETCSAAGFPAYEVSNHARPGAESRHNLVYWRYGEYAGVGPGAHGRIDQESQRFATETERHPESWLQRVEREGHGLIVNERLSAPEQADEFLLMGLRLREGVDRTRYARLAGRSFDAARVQTLESQGFIEIVGERLRVSGAGFPILNAIVADLAA